jgi:hypothetical protein
MEAAVGIIHKTFNLLSIFPDIVYRSTSNTTLFSQINNFSSLSSFLIISALALKECIVYWIHILYIIIN